MTNPTSEQIAVEYLKEGISREQESQKTGRELIAHYEGEISRLTGILRDSQAKERALVAAKLFANSSYVVFC